MRSLLRSLAYAIGVCVHAHAQAPSVPERVVTVDPSSAPQAGAPRWDVPGGPLNGFVSEIHDDRTLFLLCETEPSNQRWSVNAFDLETGELRWTRSISEFIPFWVGATDNAVYIELNKSVLVLSKADGRSLFSVPFPEIQHDRIKLADGRLIAPIRGRLLVFDAASGKKTGEFDSKTYHGDALPAGDTLYWVDGNGRIYALDPSTCKVRWEDDQAADPKPYHRRSWWELETASGFGLQDKAGLQDFGTKYTPYGLCAVKGSFFFYRDQGRMIAFDPGRRKIIWKADRLSLHLEDAGLGDVSDTYSGTFVSSGKLHCFLEKVKRKGQAFEWANVDVELDPRSGQPTKATTYWMPSGIRRVTADGGHELAWGSWVDGGAAVVMRADSGEPLLAVQGKELKYALLHNDTLVVVWREAGQMRLKGFPTPH